MNKNIYVHRLHFCFTYKGVEHWGSKSIECPVCYHRRTGQHPLGGGQTKFCPNGEHKLFLTQPRHGKNNELLKCLFFDGLRVVPDERLLCYPTRNVYQVDGYVFLSVTQLVKQMCCHLPELMSYLREMGSQGAYGFFFQVLPKAQNFAHMCPMAHCFDFCRAPRRAPPSGPPFLKKKKMAATSTQTCTIPIFRCRIGRRIRF